MELVVFLMACAVLGFIPALIASSKGRDFTTWWIYGALLFIVALVHSLVLRSRDAPSVPSTLDAAEELTKFAALRAQDVISEDEFQAQKARIMKQLGSAGPSASPAMGEGQY